MKQHPGYFALVFVVAGILAADLAHPPAWALLALASIAAASGWLFLSHKLPQSAAGAFGLVLFSLAALGYGLRVYAFGPDHLSRVATYGQRCRIVGAVADWPSLKPDRTELTVAVDTLAGEGPLAVSGRLLVRLADTSTAIERGDRVEFYGQILPVPTFSPGGSFDYGRYLRLHGIAGIVYLRSVDDIRVSVEHRFGLTRLVDRLRAAIDGALYAHLSPTSAALAAGFLIGETRNIPPGIYRQFRNSGTLHLLAVSGSNVALVILFAMILLRPFRLRRTARAIVLLAVIGLFTMLSYEQPSVVRAAVMASLVIVGRLVERRIDLNHIVAVAAVIILLAAPAQLFDIGFQLSFVTAWGLIFATPRVYALFPSHQRRLWFRLLVLPLTVAVVAQLFSTPLIALYFQRIPLISPLANLVIVPLVSVAVVGVLVVLVAALLFPPLGHVSGALLNHLMDLILHFLRIFTHGGIPLVDTGAVSSAATIGAYLCLVLFFAALSSPRARRGLVLAVALLTTIFLGTAVGHSLHRPRTVDIMVTTVPGGLAVLAAAQPSGPADLVLTGLSARPYPVHERVLYPLLDRAKIRHLRSVTLLSADFKALDYVLRLTDSLAVERLCLHQRLKATYADFIQFADFKPASPVVFYGGTAPAHAGESYLLDSAGVRLRLAGEELLVADPRSQPSAPPSGLVSVLVTDRRGLGRSDFLRLLGPDGYRWIICAKVAQHAAETALYPPGLIDLSRVGEVRLRVDREAQNSMQVIGLD